MSGAGRDTVECGDLRLALQQQRALTAAQQAHVDDCNECLEVWLDSAVTQALNTRPSAEVSADFAARVAAGLPAIYGGESPNRGRKREHVGHWGLITAVVLLAVGMVVMTVVNPVGLHTWMGITFLMLVASEIAGIALWLGWRSAVAPRK